MSIHPSLASQDKGSKSRSVLKRTERLKFMSEKNKWKEGDDVYGLPKIKTLRIKIKKEKAVKEEEGALAAGEPVPGAAGEPQKEAQQPAKGSTAKKSEDKK
jgi:small basic protein (TIGR04137 family)